MKHTSTFTSYTTSFRTYLSLLSRLIEKERHVKPTILINMIIDSDVNEMIFFHFNESFWNDCITLFELNSLMVIVLFQKQSWWHFVFTYPHIFFTHSLLPLLKKQDKNGWSLLHYACLISAYTKNSTWLQLLIDTHPQLLSLDFIQSNEFVSFLIALDSPFILSIISSKLSLESLFSSSLSSSSSSLPSNLPSSSFPFILDLFDTIQSLKMLQYLSMTIPNFTEICHSYPLSYFYFLNKSNAMELLQWWHSNISSSFLYHSFIHDLLHYIDSLHFPSKHVFSLLKFLTPLFRFSSSFNSNPLSFQDLLKNINAFSLFFSSILDSLTTELDLISNSTLSSSLHALNRVTISDESETLSYHDLFPKGTPPPLSLFPLSKTSLLSLSTYYCPFPFCHFETSSPKALSQHFESHSLEDTQLDYSYRSTITPHITHPPPLSSTTTPLTTTTTTSSSSSLPFSSYLFLTCQFCGSMCSDVNSLYHHVVLHDADKWEVIKPLLLVPFPFSCETCNNLFATTKELLIHNRAFHLNSKK